MPQPFDIMLEREAIYQDFDDQPGPCPRCGEKLVVRYQSYFVATRTGDDLDSSFDMGGDFGWFCATCPTVVINSLKVREMLSFLKPGRKIGAEFAVLGLIDLEAVPENRRHLPFGHDNPMPLVAFKGIGEADEEEAEPPRAAAALALWPPRRPRPADEPQSKKPRRKKKR